MKGDEIVLHGESGLVGEGYEVCGGFVEETALQSKEESSTDPNNLRHDPHVHTYVWLCQVKEVEAKYGADVTSRETGKQSVQRGKRLFEGCLLQGRDRKCG